MLLPALWLHDYCDPGLDVKALESNDLIALFEETARAAGSAVMIRMRSPSSSLTALRSVGIPMELL